MDTLISALLIAAIFLIVVVAAACLYQIDPHDDPYL